MNAPVAEGDVIAGKYRVERILGKGGMGVIVAATHVHLPQKVAIKFLLSDASEDSTKRFLREARAAVRLKGDHVVRVLDVGEIEGGKPYIVMEYLDGSDLSQVLQNRAGMVVEEAVDLLLQACEAIAEAHAAGIVHRDLKPANLFLTTAADGSRRLKVLDFGISKDFSPSEASGALTQTEEMIGSPLYMSPEQMKSTRSVDTRTDVWALGAILYRMLTGQPPFQADSLTELILKVTSDEPTPPAKLCATLDPALAKILLQCLTKNPAKRIQTVAELAAALVPFGPPGSQAAAERVARLQGGSWSTTSRRRAATPLVKVLERAPEGRGSTLASADSGPGGVGAISSDAEHRSVATISAVESSRRREPRGKWRAAAIVAVSVTLVAVVGMEIVRLQHEMKGPQSMDLQPPERPMNVTTRVLSHGPETVAPTADPSVLPAPASAQVVVAEPPDAGSSSKTTARADKGGGAATSPASTSSAAKGTASRGAPAPKPSPTSTAAKSTGSEADPLNVVLK